MTYKFTINRDTWLRGEPDDSFLLRDDGFMCCLGQIAEQCGVPRDHLLNMDIPAGLLGSDEFNLAPHPVIGMLAEKASAADIHIMNIWFRNTTLAHDAMTINDSYNYSDVERESRLIKLFAKHNIELEFIGTRR